MLGKRFDTIASKNLRKYVSEEGTTASFWLRHWCPPFQAHTFAFAARLLFDDRFVHPQHVKQDSPMVFTHQGFDKEDQEPLSGQTDSVLQEEQPHTSKRNQLPRIEEATKVNKEKMTLEDSKAIIIR